jgi:hypothetical protein
MKQGHCVFEEKIAEASRSGRWNDELLAHVAGCRSCEEVALVASYLCESSSEAIRDAQLPDAGRIWWRAQLAANAAAMEMALRPIAWARRLAFGSCAAALLVAVVIWWPRLGGFLRSFVDTLSFQRASASAGHDGTLFLFTAVFLVIFLPLIFGLYAVWSED